MSLSTVKITQLTPAVTLNAGDLFVIANKTNTGSPETHSLSAQLIYNFIANQNVLNFLPISGGNLTGPLFAPEAVFTSLTASSATINIINITNYELSGFRVLGDLSIYGNVSGYNLRTSFNQGLALGDYSFAEGNSTTAQGNNSHAEGLQTTASGVASHAEGSNTTASGLQSHAEGLNTVASNQASHAEGLNTVASGNRSHAEGENTVASGLASHAEGGFTTAAGGLNGYTHAEGFSTQALSSYCHAEGWSTIASNNASHAEGRSTVASGLYSHAEGLNTDATNTASHAEGRNTVASGLYSHAEGNITTASGDSSHAEGYSTDASGIASHSEGNVTSASGDYGSHAEGTNTIALGTASHAEGSNTLASGTASHAAGYKATAAQNYTYAWSDGNLGTLTSNVSSTRTGQYMVSASGGVFIPGNVGIGTDNNSNALTVNGNVSSSRVIYSNELDFGSLERPSLTGIKQALNSFLYISPALSYVRINGNPSPILEVGQALTTPTITWTSNKVEPQAVSQYLLTRANGNTSTGNFTFSTFNDPNTYNITTIGGTATQQTSSWSVRVTDWAGAQATGTTTASWLYRVYYGVTNQSTPTDAQILAGVVSETNRPLATGRLSLGIKSVSPSNQYFYVAYPQRFGITSTLKVNGLNFNDFTQQSIVTFTNASGGTDSYYVYRSNNLLTATYDIEIV